MAELRISGGSDDLMELEGALSDEFSDLDEVIVKLKSKSTGEKCFVVANYGVNGTWAVAPQQIDEDTPLPDWNFRTRQHPSTAYSVELVCDVPDDIKAKQVSVE